MRGHREILRIIREYILSWNIPITIPNKYYGTRSCTIHSDTHVALPIVADTPFSVNPGGKEWVECKTHTVEQYVMNRCKHYCNKWKITEGKKRTGSTLPPMQRTAARVPISRPGSRIGIDRTDSRAQWPGNQLE